MICQFLRSLRDYKSYRDHAVGFAALGLKILMWNQHEQFEANCTAEAKALVMLAH